MQSLASTIASATLGRSPDGFDRVIAHEDRGVRIPATGVIEGFDLRCIANQQRRHIAAHVR
jgi:hypothetical protein